VVERCDRNFAKSEIVWVPVTNTHSRSVGGGFLEYSDFRTREGKYATKAPGQARQVGKSLNHTDENIWEPRILLEERPEKVLVTELLKRMRLPIFLNFGRNFPPPNFVDAGAVARHFFSNAPDY
jgi:hypothetical protein